MKETKDNQKEIKQVEKLNRVEGFHYSKRLEIMNK